MSTSSTLVQQNCCKNAAVRTEIPKAYASRTNSSAGALGARQVYLRSVFEVTSETPLVGNGPPDRADDSHLRITKIPPTMPQSSATKILRNRIVLIFDFDETLGPSTTRTVFDALGLDYAAFKREADERKADMWQKTLAKADLLRQLSQAPGSPLTRENMEKVGADFPLYDGADTLVERLREHVEEIDDQIEVEFVLLTAGFKTVPAASKIGDQFDRIYGGEYHFDEQGRILGVKRVITHVDKVHYVKQLAQGLNLDDPSELEDTYLRRAPEDYYVPLSQIIYVGDGSSDMSAFQVVEEGGGVAIAVDPDDGDWDGYDQMAPDRRVHNIAKAQYKDGDELMEALRLATTMMTHRIQLLRLGEGE